MNVYLVRSSCEVDVPGRGLRQIYPAVEGDVRGIDMIEHFDGRPYPRKWRAMTLRLDKPRLPQPDFFCFWPKVLLCGARATDVVGALLRASGFEGVEVLTSAEFVKRHL